MRGCASGLISGRMSGICVPWAIDEELNRVCLRCWAGLWGRSATSSKVFHAPQSGHFPTHLLCSPPHYLQIYFVRSFAIKISQALKATQPQGAQSLGELACPLHLPRHTSTAGSVGEHPPGED